MLPNACHAAIQFCRSLPAPQDDLRRAVEEKVTALHLLASAERKLVEAQADESGALLPFRPCLGSSCKHR